MKRADGKLEEFVFVDTKDKKDEIVIYRDVDDIGRVFVTNNTLQRFHMIKPAFKLLLDRGDDLFEISPQDVIYIVEHADNEAIPYTVRYQNFDFKNELIDEAQKNKKVPATDNSDIVNIYRDVENSDKAYVTLDILKRFQLAMPQHRVVIGDKVVYEIDSVDAINIINNANNRFAPYQIQYVNLQLDRSDPKHSHYHDKLEELKRHLDTVFSSNDKFVPDAITQSSTKVETKDEDYLAYLKEYRKKMFSPQEAEEDADKQLFSMFTASTTEDPIGKTK